MLLFKEFILRLAKVKNLPSSLVNIFLLINWKKQNKFEIFKDNILEEEFLTEHDKKVLLDLYISVVKLMSKLKSVVRIYKFKKAVKYDIDTDLYLNPLQNLPESQKIIILENKTLYNFKLRDLLSCWKIALLNSQGLFSKPIAVKNPYTNIPIKSHNLYNIYFKCLNMYVNLPLCITNFFKCNMNINKFQLYYFTTLKEVAVINFMNTNNYYEMFEQILNLLHDYRKQVDYLTFTNYCPPSTRIKAVKIFKPLLINYLLSKYSCNPIVKEQKERLLKNQIKKMNENFTDFGFDRGFEVMRYVPLSERPSRTQPPPPPTTLISQLRNRRATLRRRRRINSRDLSESDSDDSSDLDIVETIVPPNNTITVAPPPPINIVIPPPPPVVQTMSRPSNPPPHPPLQIESATRPTNPPPPPPVVTEINTNTNPFAPTRQIPRTPIRNTNTNTNTNTNIDISSRTNISSMNNNLRLNLVRRNHINGLNFNIR